MSRTQRLIAFPSLFVFLAFFLGICVSAFAWVKDGAPKWKDGNVALKLQMPGGTSYTDGTTPNENGQSALTAWNPYLKRIQLVGTNAGQAAGGEDNKVNEVFFATNVYGYTFDYGVLAITLTSYTTEQRIESDVIVNSGINWDSYRGSLRTKTDLRRVLTHEFGHILGLDHPDEAGFYVTSLMNSTVSSLEVPQTDDQNGAQSLYGDFVNPLPSIIYGPYGSSIYEGNTFSLYINYSSTTPCTFQWYKDGELIAGATSLNYQVSGAKVSDSGKYHVVVTNYGGSVSSSSATVTVYAVTAPSINISWNSSTVVEGASLTIYSNVSSAVSYTLQWYKDGNPITGSTGSYYTKAVLGQSDAGTYHCVATNVKGSTSSNSLTLKVEPAKLPVINTETTTYNVSEGTSLNLSPSISGSAPMSYQWFHDGVAVGSTSTYYSYFSINSLTWADRGTYSLKVTNAAGSVTKDIAIVNLVQAPLPKFVSVTDWTNIKAYIGNTLYLSPNYIYQGGSGTLSFQWYKEGVLLPEQKSSTLSISNISFSEAGNYSCVITTPAGIIATPDIHVSVLYSSYTTFTNGWIKALRIGDVMYFVFPNPARVERYDLASDTWLTSFSLVKEPVSACSDSSRLFVAHFNEIVQLDLTTGKLSSLPFSPKYTVKGIMLSGEDLLCIESMDQYSSQATVEVLNASSGKLQAITSGVYPFPSDNHVVSTNSQCFYLTAIDSYSITALKVAANKTVSYDSSLSMTSNSLASSKPLALSPNEQRIFDANGSVYDRVTRGLTTFMDPYLAISFDESGHAFKVQGKTLVRYSNALEELSQAALSIEARTLALKNGKAYCFAYPASGKQMAVEIIKVDEFTTRTAAAAVDPRLTPTLGDGFVIDKNGNLCILDRQHRQIFRWNTDTRTFAESSIPLKQAPIGLTYSSSSDSLFLSCSDSHLEMIDLSTSSPRESFFCRTANAPGSILALPDGLASLGRQNYSSVLCIYSYAGKFLGRFDLSGSPVMNWSPTNARLYASGYSLNSFKFTEGVPTVEKSGNYLNASPAWIQCSSDGNSLLFNDGSFYSTTSLLKNNTLSTSLDLAEWHLGKLYGAVSTDKGLLLQRFGGSNYGVDASIALTGQARALFSLPSGKLLLVLNKNNRLYFAQLNADLSLASLDDSMETSRLMNLSARANAGAGENSLIIGFVVNGSEDKKLLTRSVGPSLDSLAGIKTYLPDPRMSLYSSAPRLIGENDNWEAQTNLADFKSLSAKLGAFALDSGSTDAAMVLTQAPGLYSIITSDTKDRSGVALVEIYDASSASNSHLINLSTRGLAASGNDTLIAGLVIGGTAPKRVLIRGIGPTLSTQGVKTPLADPVLRCYNQKGVLLYENDDWGGTSTLARVMSITGAFALPSSSKDAALYLTLQPGVYTVHVVSKNSSSGVALIEIYDADE